MCNMQHSSPSAPASSSSTRVANCNATPVSVLPGNGDDGPHCIHGPAIKFERGGVVFYACSVERDNKSGGGGECGFRHNVAKEGEMTDAKIQKWKARDGNEFIFYQMSGIVGPSKKNRGMMVIIVTKMNATPFVEV